MPYHKLLDMPLAKHLEFTDTGARCTDCGAHTHGAYGVLRHTSRCDVSPKQQERVDFERLAEEAASAAKVDVAAAAKAGTAFAVTDEDGLRDEVRAKRISVSDAMNQDF